MPTGFFICLLLSCFFCLKAGADEAFYISRQAARIMPRRVMTVPAPEAGEITFLHLSEGKVKENTTLAVVNEATILLSERRMEHEIAQQRLEVDKAILKLRKSREELEFVAGLSPQQRAYTEQRLKVQVDERMLAVIDREIAMLEEKFRLSEETLRTTAEKKRRACTLLMPFDGRVQYHLPLPDKAGESIPLPASAPVMTVVDDSAFFLVLPASNPAWAKLEHERLMVRINLGEGETLEAPWHHSKVEKSNQSETLFYYFLLAEKDNERAAALLGANIISELFYLAPGNCLCIHKADLAFQAGETPFESWEKLVDALYPGYSIVFVGETHLCLRHGS